MVFICVGIIGFVVKDLFMFVVGEWGVQYFKVFREFLLYEIVVVCNSLVELVQKFIVFYKFDLVIVKVYGLFEDIVVDLNVDFVVVVVVIKYYLQLIKFVI